MSAPADPIDPLLDHAEVEQLRQALREYTVDGVHERLGLAGQASLQRGDLSGVRRCLDGSDETATLIRLFLLGEAVPAPAARAALAPLTLGAAVAAGLLLCSAGSARARFDLRPYAEADSGEESSWWVLSDFGSDVRPGPLAAEHVVGISAASLTLAQATVRDPVRRALDLGTGCGIQALHLSRHVSDVVATDLSSRALRLAATTAALSGVTWDLRSGSLMAPVAGEQFDLIVANPPFVVSPGLAAGSGGHTYRDSGQSGDGVSRELLSGLPRLLAPGGVAQLLANWIIPTEGDWTERITGWLAGRGCDAWVWQREIAESGEYVRMWLRDAGEVPGSSRWNERYDTWMDWLQDNGVAAIGMGMATLWRTDAEHPVIVCEDVPQQVEQPAGRHLGAWPGRQRWLAATPPSRLPEAILRCTDGVLLTRQAVRADRGWQVAYAQLRQSHGMRWEIEVDEAVAGLVAACDGRTRLGVALAVLASSVAAPVEEVTRALDPVIRDLVARGLLEVVA